MFLARVLALVTAFLLMPPLSPLYGQGSIHDAPGTHAEDEGHQYTDESLPFTILLYRSLQTPYGVVEFAVRTYQTPSGETCYDTTVAEAEGLIGKAGGGFCANAPLGPDEHIRSSMGSQMLFFKPPSVAADVSPEGVEPLQYWVTDISGNVGPRVDSVAIAFQSITIADIPVENGAFIALIPGYVEAPEVTVVAFDARGRELQTNVLKNCLVPSCEPQQ